MLFAVAASVCLYSSGANTSDSSRPVVTANSKPGAAEPGGLQRTPPNKGRLDVHGLTAHLPLSFEQNIGQLDSRAKFFSREAGYSLFLTSTGAILELPRASLGPPSPQQNRSLPRNAQAALSLKLQGANPHAIAEGVDPLPGHVNYFIGNDPRKWHKQVPTFRAVRYEGIYPGVQTPERFD